METWCDRGETEGRETERLRGSERGKTVNLNISPCDQKDLSSHHLYFTKNRKSYPPSLSVSTSESEPEPECICFSLPLLFVIPLLIPILSQLSTHTHPFSVMIYPFISRVSLKRAVWLSRLITVAEMERG